MTTPAGISITPSALRNSRSCSIISVLALIEPHLPCGGHTASEFARSRPLVHVGGKTGTSARKGTGTRRAAGNRSGAQRCDLFLLLVTFALAGNSIAQSQKPLPAPTVGRDQKESHAPQANKEPTPDPPGSEKNPLFVKSVEAQKTSERAEQHRAERDERSTNERRMVTWTIALGIATIVLAFIAGGQLLMFWKQMQLMLRGADDTKNLAIAAQASAQAAKAQAEALVTSERAWVSWVDVSPGDFSNATFPTGETGVSGTFFTISWQNSGRTPAIDCGLLCQGIVREVDEGIPTFVPLNIVPEARAPLVPGLHVQSPSFPFKKSDIDRLIQRQCKIFLYGRVDYKDFFRRA